MLLLSLDPYITLNRLILQAVSFISARLCYARCPVDCSRQSQRKKHREKLIDRNVDQLFSCSVGHLLAQSAMLISLFSDELERLAAQSEHLAVRWPLDCYILFRPEL